MRGASCLALVGFLAPLGAQSLWVVNADGGPGVQFTTLSAAVAAAVDGDTIVCQHPTFGSSLGGFTTGKALTIVGDAAGVPLTTNVTPIQVVGLPAGRTFRMAGFQAVLDGELRITVQNCAGSVVFDNLQAREPDFFFPTTPAIDISNSTSVVLRDVVDFGVPAVRVTASRVVLTSCWLGVTQIGLGGGPCLQANGADIDIVQPNFRTAGLLQTPSLPYVAIEATNSTLRIAGSAAALISGGPPVSAIGGSAVVANGGIVTRDANVVLAAGVGQPVTTGTAAFFTRPVPATWTPMAAEPGQPLVFASTAAAGSAVWLALGPSGPQVSTPLGWLGIEPTGHAFFPVAIASGVLPVANLTVVPATLPRGQAFAAQAVVWDGVLLQLGAPVAFVIQ